MIIIIPDKATKSRGERPFALNRSIRASRVEVGGGMAPLTAAKLAVWESLLPNFTSQLGPPSYNNNNNNHDHYQIKPTWVES